MTPGPAAICEGRVWHRRNRPVEHEFSYPMSQIWIDPDRPEQLTAQHPLWSATHWAPGRFRRYDYGLDQSTPLGDEIRALAGSVLGYIPEGEIRMLSQARRWGWMFNPITVFVVWHTDPHNPVAAVAEVTNTPWKERTQYPVPLVPRGDRTWQASFDKTLHVSPFLHEDFGYDLTIIDHDPDLEVKIDVLEDNGSPIVETAVRLTRSAPTTRSLSRALTRGALSTRIVSFGIHAQAARLWRRRVPIVPHPSKRQSPSPAQHHPKAH